MTRCTGGIWPGERGASRTSECTVYTHALTTALDPSLSLFLYNELFTALACSYPRTLNGCLRGGKVLADGDCCVCKGVRSRTPPCYSPEDMGKQGTFCVAICIITLAWVLFTGKLMSLLGTLACFFIFLFGSCFFFVSTERRCIWRISKLVSYLLD